MLFVFYIYISLIIWLFMKIQFNNNKNECGDMIGGIFVCRTDITQNTID